MIAVAQQPRVTDASVDRQGRVTLTIKLDKRLYQTVRLDKLMRFDVRTTIDYIESDTLTVPFRVKGSERTTGSIDFISHKQTISNKRPKH